MIISVHIPKTGGTTFRHFLTKSFDNEIVFDYQNSLNIPDSGSINNNFTEPQLIHTKRVLNIPKNIKVIHGHLIAEKYNNIYPRAKLITWFRDPLQIKVSSYFHLKRHKIYNNKYCKMLHENNWNLEQFIKNTKINPLSNYLGDKILSDFNFIGITEMYKESIDLFCRMFKIKNYNPIEMHDVNPRKKISDSYNISNQLNKYLKNELEEEIILYEKAKNILLSNLDRL
jgi:hypothetical protein